MSKKKWILFTVVLVVGIKSKHFNRCLGSGCAMCDLSRASMYLWQSTIRKKMATGTFTYNALHTKTLKERIETQRKIVSHSNLTRVLSV